MKIFRVFFLLLLPFLLFNAYQYGNVQRYDVVVYGGTPAGIAAAIQVARSGRTVALLEPTAQVGGIIVNGLGSSDIDNHDFQNSKAVGGIALEFYRRVAKYYGRLAAFDEKLKAGDRDVTLWRFEPHVAEQIIQDLLGEYDIDVFCDSQIQEDFKSVQKEGTAIRTIETTNGKLFYGKVFIDATLEGDLFYYAGITTTWGRESNQLYGETKNGIRAETTHAQFKVNVDPYVIPGDSTSGLIATIQDEPFGTPCDGDKSIQAYCFRMCLTDDADNRIPFRKPDNYDRSQYEIYLRYLKAGGKLYTPYRKLPNGKTDLGAWHDLSHNLYGMNRLYPSGDAKIREMIFDQHKTFTQGLFYFLANDPEVGILDSALQHTWSEWGLCKDEFTDNEGWPRQFYVRDARRMVSDYVITEQHTKRINPTPVSDPVAVAYWPPDLHSVRRIVKDAAAYNEGFVFGGNDWRPFGISYQALIPRKEESTNLLSPTCVSASHVAYGAIRIEFTYMALGQACGAAAVLAIDSQCNVQDVSYPELQEMLKCSGQILDAESVGMPPAIRVK
ncbi:FAD-dependent oxidoreductase [Mangrovibacterium diazotrophicum]|uniref:FAD dependent oxidoreductase n=1 Tax=Mangrovibacterium diazotrophicum TaxID=1261403 RepID=A0A419W4E8_9BACT|nr:FAD-dependent oxidoreductase [Mangrovibacterium diazotrophicum]RKD90341.1 FAD dependent oxidoreductase [Mangrovibacterium diazotrophicum]